MAESRYRSAEIIDNKFYGTIDFPSQKQIDGLNVFRIRASQFERLDNLAFKHLGSGEYWWVIALVNDLDWPFNIKEGQILKIPVEIEDVLRFF